MNIFVTGTGTGVGKTVVAAIIARALGADYWKPVQAGNAGGTDSDWVRSVTSSATTVHPEAYKLAMAASPHIAARAENTEINLRIIREAMPVAANLVIEGAGGLMVPLNDREFVADMIDALEARVVIVSRNELGSINHSMLTAMACKQKKLRVLGWIFNEKYMAYENEIAAWSGYHNLGSVPFTEQPDKNFIEAQAALMEPNFYNWPW